MDESCRGCPTFGARLSSFTAEDCSTITNQNQTLKTTSKNKQEFLNYPAVFLFLKGLELQSVGILVFPGIFDVQESNSMDFANLDLRNGHAV
jgi:hypothetical protein